MFPAYFKKPLYACAVFLLLWLGFRFVLPVALPFLLGAGIAFAAEPLVRKLSGKLPRAAAAGMGVTATLLGVAAVISLAGALAVRELGNLTRAAPDLSVTAQQGITVLQDWLVNLSDRAPDTLRPALQRTVLDFFGNGTVLLQQVSQKIPSILSATISTVGNGILGLGTGILSAFLISARLPQLRKAVAEHLPNSWREKLLPALQRVRASLGGWLKAQLKLCAITFGIVTVGFFLLRIPYAPVWSALVALIDAVPILGTGTILVPWAIVCLLQQESLRAIGLLSVYGACALCRTALEPRLVGTQLGLNPLTTLISLYVGYRFWGFPGLILTPILASAAKSLITAK